MIKEWNAALIVSPNQVTWTKVLFMPHAPPRAWSTTEIACHQCEASRMMQVRPREIALMGWDMSWSLSCQGYGSL